MTQYQFVRSIVNDPDHPGEVLLDLGDEICELLGWKPGDPVEFIDNGDGTFTLRKKESADE